jgi:two-component system sensor histidine kinase KdpD
MTVRGEETYVEQVLRNLLSNAAKYSPAGTAVEVVLDETPEGARVRVLDSGPGVRTEEVDRLFQLYYRSPETAAKAGGAGIGLFVCRALVEAMGGRIWAAPRPDGGSEFGFILQRYADDEVVPGKAT